MVTQPPLFSQFANLLNNAIHNQDGQGLLKLLPIEPPFDSDYGRLLNEIFSVFKSLDSLKASIRSAIAVIAKDDKDAWHAFSDFLATYFEFIRNLNVENLLETYERLSNLLT
jgi:nuclear mRNA export protein PCID2/THP1